MDEKMTSLERDTLSRNRIVSEIDHIFFVEAGAGSGKTTMLVNRMVAMVEAGLDISKICAITFTKAAAGEFYDRFQKLLIERSNPTFEGEKDPRPGALKTPTEETRERCRTALQNIDLCFMGTIDSFCNMVLSEHPSEAGIPSDAAVVSSVDAEIVYKQQYVKLCEGVYGEELQALAKIFQGLHRNAQDVFVRGISFIMDNRNVCFHFDRFEPVDIDRVFAADRAELIEALNCLLDHPELKYDGNKDSAKAWEALPASYADICRRWSSNYANLLYGLKKIKDLRVIRQATDRYPLSLGNVFFSGESQRKWLECSIGQEGGLYDQLLKIQYDASMTFLTRSIPVMEQALREKGLLTFFDCLYYLRNMLKRDAENDGTLIRYINARHRYFLIDEFQDTNPMQAEVFFYLASDHPIPQWSSCIPRPGSLFIVGDPKQSIYRFRSADVTSFLNVRRLFEANGGSILSLSRNFRSTSCLCEYYNRVFTELLPEESENQSKFEDIPLPEPADGEFQGVYTYTAYTGEAEKVHPEMADPVQVADIIERLVGNERYMIRGEKETSFRPIRYSDIMVITYGKSKLKPIMAELHNRSIPTKVEGSVPFADDRVLREIYLIYASVSDPYDTLSLYGALSCEWSTLSKADILRFKACGGEISLKGTYDFEDCIDQAALHVDENIKKLKELHFQALRLSPAALFVKILDDFRLYETVPAENMEVVYYALELLRNAENSGLVVTLKDGASYLRDMVSGDSEEERCLSFSQNKNCVHMANLHKVKGLEAPIVILAAAGKKAGTETFRLIHRDNDSHGYIFAIESKRDRSGISSKLFSTTEFPDERIAEKEALKAEGQRLVYVAATRARNALILCNSIYMRNGREIGNSKWTPIMEKSIPDLFMAIEANTATPVTSGLSMNADDLYEAAEESSALNNRSMEKNTFHAESPSHLRVRSKLSGSNTTVIDENDANSHQYSALLGTMTHRLMETLVTSGNAIDTGTFITEIVREYLMPGMKSLESTFTDILTKVLEHIRNGGYVQTNGAPQDILKVLLNADEVHCEMPFSYKDEDGIIWNGIMDVVYAESGKWHIIDYKTNADGSDLDLRYQEQMAAYGKAFKAITGIDADVLTYHIDI